MRRWAPYIFAPLVGVAMVLPTMGWRIGVVCYVATWAITAAVSKLSTGKWFP